MDDEKRSTTGSASRAGVTQVALRGVNSARPIAPEARQQPRAERYARGQSMRAHVPRSVHAAWAESAMRPDPVALLESQAESRVPDLLPIRYARMQASVFAFLRGAAIVMAHDLSQTPTTGILTQICGDAHLANFGLYGSPERNLVFDINDFDETLPGPWEWDVKRLAASCHVAGRHNAFTETDCRAAVIAAVGSYRRQMLAFAAMHELDVWYARVTADDLSALITSKQTKRKAQEAMAKTKQRDNLRALSKLTDVVDGHRIIVNDPPLVVRISAAAETGRLNNLFERYRRTLGGAQRHMLQRFHIMDFARKIVGIGSVGTRCYILLLAGSDDNDVLFLQIKEALPSVLEGHLPRSVFTHQGERVVDGQELMQATSDLFLGWLRDDDGRDYYVRQLHDMKGTIKVELLSPTELALWASACGWALARAHARGGHAVEIAAYLGTNETFDRAIADFAQAYSDQTERDYQAFLSAIATGRLVVAQAD